MATCANCSRQIGKLETPCVWKNPPETGENADSVVVCPECFDRLERQHAPTVYEDRPFAAKPVQPLLVELADPPATPLTRALRVLTGLIALAGLLAMLTGHLVGLPFLCLFGLFYLLLRVDRLF